LACRALVVIVGVGVVLLCRRVIGYNRQVEKVELSGYDTLKEEGQKIKK
jgi:hypothetical protein